MAARRLRASRVPGSMVTRLGAAAGIAELVVSTGTSTVPQNTTLSNRSRTGRERLRRGSSLRGSEDAYSRFSAARAD
jgi:hypothetical protein